jgi:indole-3-glycerol phosphate synthase
MPGVIEDRLLGELMSQTRILNMAALVVVHNEAQITSALRCRARIIAISARDPETLLVDHQRIESLIDKVPSDRVRLVIGGFATAAQVDAMRDRVDGVIIGSALMGASDPRRFAKQLGF